MTPLKITDYTLTTALGRGKQENINALQQGKTGLSPCHFYDIKDLNTWVGEVNEVESTELPTHLRAFTCRNNQLSALTLSQDHFAHRVQEKISQYGSHRIGVFIGTSTSGIHDTEKAYLENENNGVSLPEWYNYSGSHNIYSCAEFIRQYFALNGYSTAISTACSSSAKVFASAERAIASGLCDAAIVGGVDTLCLTTLYGFNALQVVSPDICKPSNLNRLGINIGEAAGFAFIEPATEDDDGFGVLGYGESSDAYHMSTPHPEGKGAALAMQKALNKAQLSAADIDYINLHGTGTPANDLSESKAIVSVFGSQTPCSSTKGWTGHTLGAAGIIEALFSLFTLENQWIPASLNTDNIDPDIMANINTLSRDTRVQYTLSNSFGFGGSNCSLVLGAVNR
ncbi:beta-ketoacyl-[acyl-carrier-protein] synthase family protein [Marinibactrum halimedae]|uniref:Beta-ketoacyl-[acyl-carrier-protein] synthase II n=1 Tax=Marinibactrum halimedae TaxID=1444977 RepID=A0AA37T565_9GAMM|nr:beta-ketoacyl-[acyl-carrier-protein] synthase family protein [Marinibactrum halimedae]MCD9460426.1 beta-ketoacyl-[acyl-carrier-protein] synthase family protein [Marinibactrum halimedae]GLS27443.1 beta-ketoacyl-[acyl-carrier-protein] synthase II [Marinibactrum halimedae]